MELPDSLLEFFPPQMILKLDAVHIKKWTLKNESKNKNLGPQLCKLSTC